MKPRALLPVLLAGLALRAARAEGPPAYGPVPPGLAALVGTTQEERLAADAIERLDDASEARDALSLLVLAGDAGLRRAAERLASGQAGDAERDRLLVALDASARPEVDGLFATAAGEARAETRALAAHGLGGGRSPAAPEVLKRLAADPMPLVRAAAVRALFAIDSAEARAARLALPDDRDPRIAGMRLRLHRQRGDGGPDLLRVGERGRRNGSEPVRLEAARCLALPDVPAPPALLALVLSEYGGSADPATLAALRAVEAHTGVRADAATLGRPPAVSDAGAARLAASEALAALLTRPDADPALRESLVVLGVHWLAHPVWERGMRVDEPARRVLMTALPDAGRTALDASGAPVLVKAVVAQLRDRAFDDPGHGLRALTALDEATWLPAVRSLADPRGKVGPPRPTPVDSPVPAPEKPREDEDRPEGPGYGGRPPGPGDRRAPRRPRAPGDPVVDPVVRAAAGVLRDLGRVGDADVAAALVAPGVPEDVRRDGLRALAKEGAAVALPLLVAALDDLRDPIASTAADVLLERAEPPARDALERMLLTPPRRPFEARVFEGLVAPADERAYAFLDRAFASGHDVLREAAFDAFWRAGSDLRGPRAVATVLREAEKPPPRNDFGTVARALCSVDGKAAVAFVRRHFATAPSPGVLLRNLQAVSDPGALDFALEVAASTDDPAMLGEVARVLAGPSGRDPARTEPFWRRLLSNADFGVVDEALTHLPRVEHGDLSEFVEPLVRSTTEPDGRRLAALHVLVKPWRPDLEGLLWRIASHPSEPEDLRVDSAKALLGRASPELRAKALAWLREGDEEPGTPILWIARVVGSGASPAEAAALVSILETAVRRRYERPPYFRPSERPDPAYETRLVALTTAIGLSADATALDRLAEWLFDARFATYEREVRQDSAHRLPRGGGPLSPLSRLHSRLRLHRSVFVGADVDVPAPLPIEVRHLIGALKGATPAETAVRVERALASARAQGRLALFDDLYLYWLATDIHYKPHGDYADAAAPLEVAIARALPASGIEEAWLEPAVQARVRDGRFAEAAVLQAEQVRAAARAGAPDLDEDWLDRRATLDFLRGAAAATAGRVEEARDAFRAGLARLPNSPANRNSAAWFRALAAFDLEAAAADARRALDLERRLDDEESPWTLDTYGYVLLRQGRNEQAREVLGSILRRLKPESYPEGGETHWHYAAASAALGFLSDAESSVVEALQRYEPTLEPRLRADPLLRPIADRMDALVARATRNRLLGE